MFDRLVVVRVYFTMVFTPLSDPEQFRVYRFDRGVNEDLSSRNAGNLEGVLDFL